MGYGLLLVLRVRQMYLRLCYIYYLCLSHTFLSLRLFLDTTHPPNGTKLHSSTFGQQAHLAMVFTTRNLYYLRISRTTVLPFYLYLDQQHVNWMSDAVLQYVLRDLHPLYVIYSDMGRALPYALEE